MKNRIWIGLLAAVALATPLAHAQDQGLGDMMFTAGTVATDSANGQEWAWLQWMATDGAMLQDRPMDIYRADGGIGSVNPFTLKGRAQQVTDPRSLLLLLERGQALGENITNLTASVDSLYDGAAPVVSLSLAEKLAALISGSQADPELYQNLIFIGRGYPSVAMAIGQGFACRIPSAGFSTFEIRDHTTGEVIGRLELEGGNPLVLPAPGPLARVPETSPKGNLNIRLRWDVPDDLKRLSLLQFGYNLYRMTQAFAEDEGYDGGPPAADKIDALVSTNQFVVKVNRAPILIDLATASSTNWFAIDDNDGLSGGTPFEDGTNYYYFVSALDLLGRDGHLSDGFKTFPCDRFAPSVPHAIRTRTINDFISGVHTQWVEVSWAHDPADTDTARYYVYRHTGVADMQSNATSTVANRIAGPIIPSPTATRIFYEDHSLSSNDFSRTYWYTVRAEDNASCGNNLSGNSAPAFGLVRDWEGPPPATGVVVTIQLEVPEVSYDKITTVSLPAPYNTRLSCELSTPNLPIAWVEFGWYWGPYQGSGSETNIVASNRIFYSDDVEVIAKNYYFDSASNSNSLMTYLCRVGSAQGTVSEWAHAENEKPGSQSFRYDFIADILTVQKPIPSGTPAGTVDQHFWGTGPLIVFPTLTIPAVTGAESVRVYRRVNGGAQTLIHHGEMDEVLGALVTDYTGGSVNGGTICYYYQLFDEHGNAGPLVFIVCIEVAPRIELPTPILEGIDSTGTAIASPGLTLEWFCTTPGVERFEVAVALDETEPRPTFGTSGYAVQSTKQITVVVAGVTNALDFGFYRTGRVGTTFGAPDFPQFTLDSQVELDRDYTVMVRAIGVTGTPGPWSNIETFRWSTVPTAGPQVPWPPRASPNVQTNLFHADMGAEFIDSNYLGTTNRVGIRIGDFPGNAAVEFEDKVHSGQIYLLKFDPMEQLYTNSAVVGQTVMPCVLYRYQLANSLYPTVSGDVAQVSPLMEEIAYGDNAVSTIIYDPFIGITKKSSDDWGIYIIDTQPIVHGAKYQYLIMRFDENTKELDRIIPAGTVTIP